MAAHKAGRPAADCQEYQGDKVGSEDGQSPSILIAEDSDDLRGMLRQLLEANGYRILEAVDGREAVEAAINEKPELVLMDLGLPETDGLSAVAAIREHISAAEMPILIISAYDRLEYRTEAVSAGCSGYITKPVDPRALLRTIDLLLRRVEGN
jgi:two-component system cell cycle response regulator DivK